MGSAVRFLQITTFFSAFTAMLWGVCPAAFGAPAVIPGAGDIAVVSGTATIKHAGRARASEKASVGAVVIQGDVITTEKDGQVKILLRDRSILDVGPSTQMKIQSYDQGAAPNDRRVEIELDHGLLRTLVSKKIVAKSKFFIKTKTATMGVRGTEFVVEALEHSREGPPRTAVAVLQGQVSLERLDGPSSKTRLAPLLIPAGMNVVFHAGDMGPARTTFTKPAAMAALLPRTMVHERGLDNAIRTERAGGIASGLDIALRSGRAPASVDDISSHAPSAPIVVPGAFTATQVLAGPPANPLAGTGTGNHTIQVTVVRP